MCQKALLLDDSTRRFTPGRERVDFAPKHAEAVCRFEGYTDTFPGDTVMAILGVPLAHEEDEEQALRGDEAAARPSGLRPVPFAV